jgi:hypothetical protein
LVTSIDNNAFRGCIVLTSIIIPDLVTSIGSTAFFNCTSLTSITIPNLVTSIGTNAFQACTVLTVVYISSQTATNLGKTSPTNNPPGVDFFGKVVATRLPL